MRIPVLTISVQSVIITYDNTLYAYCPQKRKRQKTGGEKEEFPCSRHLITNWNL